MLQNPPKYNMNYISNFLAIRNASNGTSASSPATPQLNNNNTSIGGSQCDLDETQLERINATTGKSFTIASILGLKKKNISNSNQSPMGSKSKEVNAINLSLNQNYSMHKSAFSSIDPENRLLPNRVPLPFSHHMPSPSHIQHHPSTHFNQPNNNNNNNFHITNNNQASALQSLQQQFHSKNSQSFSHFQNNKEQRNNKSEHSVKGKSSLKNKRVRTIFTPEQLERLEGEFERQQYMVGPERLYLAHTLQLTEAQVKVWFQNRRIKWRKHHLEMTQQRLAIIRQNQIPPTNSTNTDEQLKSNNVSSDKSTTSNMIASSPALSDYESPGTTGAETSGALDSELSVCTDSMDSSSVHEIDDL